jgi:hypothetical protein
MRRDFCIFVALCILTTRALVNCSELESEKDVDDLISLVDKKLKLLSGLRQELSSYEVDQVTSSFGDLILKGGDFD